MKNLNQKGFSAVIALLLVVLIGIIGFTGWYVYSSSKKSSDLLSSGSSDAKFTHKKKSDAKTTVDPTSDWIVFSSTEGQFSLKYPPSWTKADLVNCGGSMILLGGNASSVGKCATDSGGQISASASDGNNLSSSELDSAHYTGLTSVAVTVDGVTGKKQSGTYKALADDFGIGPADGEEVVSYTFYANSKTYVIRYSKTASYPDVKSDFDTLATKTFKFRP